MRLLRTLCALSLVFPVVGCDNTDLSQVTMATVELRMTFPTTIDILGVSHTPRAVGSGFFVDNEGTVMTAKHCVTNTVKITVVTSDGKQWDARVALVHPTADIALIRISRHQGSYIHVAATDVDVHAPVTVLGSPLGITGVLTSGYLAKHGGDEDILDAGVLPGDSGAAVLNSRGKLIGVVSKLYVSNGAPTHMGICVGLAPITELLNVYQLTRRY